MNQYEDEAKIMNSENDWEFQVGIPVMQQGACRRVSSDVINRPKRPILPESWPS